MSDQTVRFVSFLSFDARPHRRRLVHLVALVGTEMWLTFKLTFSKYITVKIKRQFAVYVTSDFYLNGYISNTKSTVIN